MCFAGCCEPEGLKSGFQHLESKDKPEDSLSLGRTCSPEEQKRGAAFTLAIAALMLFNRQSPAVASSRSRAEHSACCCQNHTLVLTKHCSWGGNTTGDRSPGHSTLHTSLPLHPGCQRAGAFSTPLWCDKAAGPQAAAAQSRVSGGSADKHLDFAELSPLLWRRVAGVFPGHCAFTGSGKSTVKWSEPGHIS